MKNIKEDKNDSSRYIVNVKRGVKWSMRLLEISKDKIQYFMTDNNQVRFSENVKECTLKENETNKNVLLLISNSNKFQPIQIKCDDSATSEKIIRDFNSAVQHVNSRRNSVTKEDEKKKEENINNNKENKINWFYITSTKHSIIEYSQNIRLNDKVLTFIEKLLGSNNNSNAIINVSLLYYITHLRSIIEKILNNLKKIHTEHIISLSISSFVFYLSLMAVIPIKNIIFYIFCFTLFFWGMVIKYLLSIEIHKEIDALNNSDSMNNCSIIDYDTKYNYTLKMSSFLSNGNLHFLLNKFYYDINTLKKWNLSLIDIKLISKKNNREVYEYTQMINQKTYSFKRVYKSITSNKVKIDDMLNDNKIAVTIIEYKNNIIRVISYISMKSLVENAVSLLYIKEIVESYDTLSLLYQDELFENYSEDIDKEIIEQKEEVRKYIKDEFEVKEDSFAYTKGTDKIKVRVSIAKEFFGFFYKKKIKKNNEVIINYIKDNLNILRNDFSKITVIDETQVSNYFKVTEETSLYNWYIITDDYKEKNRYIISVINSDFIENKSDCDINSKLISGYVIKKNNKDESFVYYFEYNKSKPKVIYTDSDIKEHINSICSLIYSISSSSQ